MSCCWGHHRLNQKRKTRGKNTDFQLIHLRERVKRITQTVAVKKTEELSHYLETVTKSLISYS